MHELRAHFKETMVGVENTVMPSFNPDLTQLDEEGIRHDVRQSIAHGFASCLVATETGLGFEEAKRFVSVVTEEAGGKIKVNTTLLFDNWDQQFAMAEHAARAGADLLLLGYPHTWRPRTPEEIYDRSRELCATVPGVGMVLYPSPHFNFERFHPAGFPIDVLTRLATDVPNVVAAKIGTMPLAIDMARRVGDKILIGSPVENDQPAMTLHLGAQWMGSGLYEVFQTPERPRLVEYFTLLVEARRTGDQRKADQAMEIFWQLSPARHTFDALFNPMLGTYHWTMQKFYQWCVGGNGGVTRQPAMKLHQHEMGQIRMGYRMIGIDPDMNDETFIAGRSNASRLLPTG